MLFYLGPSFGKSLSLGNTESIDFLTRLLDSRKRGLLLIYSSTKSIKYIKEYLQSTNNIHSTELFETISKNFRQKKQLLNHLSTYIFVSSISNEKPRTKRKMIIISPRLINNSNLLYPPILLGENLTDCELYAGKISKYFTDGIPISMANLSLSDRFEPGGGNSTHASYRRHKEKKIDLCYCIVDSDRKHPSEENGETAKFVENVDKNETSAFCQYLIIDMYSAENLLPINEIERQFIEGKNQEQIKQFSIIRKLRKIPSWRHISLKKGISGKDLKKDDEKSKFWKEQLTLIGSNPFCCEKTNCNCNIVPRINEKTLANSLKREDINWGTYLNQEENNSVRSDYLKISMNIRSWLCVGLPLRS